MVQIFRILLKMFSSKWLECCCFYSSMFLTYEEAVFLPAHSYLLFSGFLLLAMVLRQWLEDLAVHLHQPLPSFSSMFCHWPNFSLHLSPPEYFFSFPLLILRLQSTYAIGCMGQAFSSWSLNIPRVLCHISRIEVMLVKAFIFTPGFTCYSSIGMFGLTESLESDLPTEPEWMDCLVCSLWAWGGFSPISQEELF